MDATTLNNAIEQAIAWLMGGQHQDGYWVGNLQSNSCMEAEWVLAMYILGVPADPKYDGVVKAILHDQRADGSWEIYYDAPAGDINATVESYAALRVAGVVKNSDPMIRAREWIFAHGGLGGVRVFTKYWLALIGEWPWDRTPALPPEIFFIPRWAPFNIYKFATWARATMLPLSILTARRPVHRLPDNLRMDELFPEGREHFNYRLPRKKRWLSWEGFFLATDRILNRYVNAPLRPGRETAIRLCREWIVAHQDGDGAWGGIQPPWIYSLMALHEEGYALHHPVLTSGLTAFDPPWSYERDGRIYLQPSVSPIWDTVLVLLALLDCSVAQLQTVSVEKAVRYLLSQQVLVGGDWQVFVKDTEPGGWAFEYENDKYPDVDDTAVAVIVLLRLEPLMADEGLKRAMREAVEKAVAWLIAMQNDNGGWAAFDRDCTSAILTLIPFADFGELLDPPSVDVTGHVVEALALYGMTRDDEVMTRACRYMLDEQEPDGSWFGRWGVNYIYGTGAVLPALEAAGVDMSAEKIVAAGRWLVSRQNLDGGWGESCASYMDEQFRGRGVSTASQTGWALMALIALDSDEFARPIKQGLEFLKKTQNQDGTWDEPYFTGTGFPGYGVGERIDLTVKSDTMNQGSELSRGFMLNYNMYRHYFPLMAMGRARRYLTAGVS